MTVYESPAKLNFALLVDSPRNDGLHPIESLVQTIEWVDHLEVEESEEDNLVIEGAELDPDDNLVTRSLRAVREKGFVPPLDLRLIKQIPIGAGLGGGSSNAAAMLVAATDAGRLPSSVPEGLAPSLGADVVLFLTGGTMLMTGVGEEIESLRPLSGFAVAVVVPPFEISTDDVYRCWDEMEGPMGESLEPRLLPPPLRDGIPLRNDLTAAACALRADPGRFHGRPEGTVGRAGSDDRIGSGLLRLLSRPRRGQRCGPIGGGPLPGCGRGAAPPARGVKAMTSPVADVERWSSLKVWLFSLFNKSPQSNFAAVDRMALDSGDHFLDLGCGLGAALEHAAGTGAKTAGVDPSPAMVERASERVPQAEVRLGSAESIPFDDDDFTAALSVSTYHHWADPETGLNEVRRVLAPGGRLLVVERKLKRGTGHGLDAAAAKRLSELLESHGYTTTGIETMRVGRADYLAVSAVKP